MGRRIGNELARIPSSPRIPRETEPPRILTHRRRPVEFVRAALGGRRLFAWLAGCCSNLRALSRQLSPVHRQGVPQPVFYGFCAAGHAHHDPAARGPQGAPTRERERERACARVAGSRSRNAAPSLATFGFIHPLDHELSLGLRGSQIEYLRVLQSGHCSSQTETSSPDCRLIRARSFGP